MTRFEREAVLVDMCTLWFVCVLQLRCTHVTTHDAEDENRDSSESTHNGRKGDYLIYANITAGE
jgi:hypothetical protein